MAACCEWECCRFEDPPPPAALPPPAPLLQMLRLKPERPEKDGSGPPLPLPPAPAIVCMAVEEASPRLATPPADGSKGSRMDMMDMICSSGA